MTPLEIRPSVLSLTHALIVTRASSGALTKSSTRMPAP
jgi:hypothetical protein